MAKLMPISDPKEYFSAPSLTQKQEADLLSDAYNLDFTARK
jgi:hypothetical protein